VAVAHLGRSAADRDSAYLNCQLARDLRASPYLLGEPVEVEKLLAQPRPPLAPRRASALPAGPPRKHSDGKQQRGRR
jgi:hypothetical protein